MRNQRPSVRQQRSPKQTSSLVGGKPPGIKINPAVITITGLYLNAGYLVLVDGEKRCVNQSQFEYLLELAWAAFKSPMVRYLHSWDLVDDQRPGSSIRKIVERLGEELRDPSLIANNKRSGYCLTVDLASIEFSKTLWALPPQLVAPDVLIGLKTAHAAYWDAVDGRPPQPSDQTAWSRRAGVTAVARPHA